ncbi:MAG TPA: alkylmercury lyase family protein [Thermomicrobiales bacterium]|jgi:hypothetical protein
MSAPNGRILAIGAAAHAVYRALVDALLAAGTLPDEEAVARVTGLAVAEVRAALGALVAGDWAGRDEHGAIVALYPFSLVPTPVRVRLDQSERYAMCAIDALGVAPMLDRKVAITSVCPICDAAIALTVGPGGVRTRLPEAVGIVYRRTVGPAHLSRCGATRFFCSPDDARTWLATHGGPDDLLLSPDEAFARGREIFAGWYRAGRSGG